MNNKHYFAAAAAAVTMTFSFASCTYVEPQAEKRERKLTETTIEETVEETTYETSDTEEKFIASELDINYDIIDGKACVTGFSGDGNTAVIKAAYQNIPVSFINAGAFENCTTLKSVSFYADIYEIGEAAFKGCSSLESMSFSSSLMVIKNHAFENCSGLKSMTFYGNTDIGESAFKGCSSLKSAGFNLKSAKIADHAFEDCTSLEKIGILSKDTEIGNSAFANCPKLESAPSETGTVTLDYNSYSYTPAYSVKYIDRQNGLQFEDFNPDIFEDDFGIYEDDYIISEEQIDELLNTFLEGLLLPEEPVGTIFDYDISQDQIRADFKDYADAFLNKMSGYIDRVRPLISGLADGSVSEDEFFDQMENMGTEIKNSAESIPGIQTEAEYRYLSERHNQKIYSIIGR